MTLEEAIKQERFISAHQRMLINILFTSSWLQNAQHQTLKDTGLTIQQYNILRILRGQKGNPIPLMSIADRMIDRMSNCSRIVERLRLKGLVDRQSCEHDRRAVDVIITDKGLELLKELDPRVETMKEDFNHISDEEAQLLNDLLDKLRSKED